MTPIMYARIGLILALLGSGFYGGYRWEAFRVAPLQAEISRLQAREVILENSNAQCAQDVTEANQATDRILAAGKAATERSQAALKAAQVETARIATDITVLRATSAPKDASCQVQSDAARGVLLDEVRRANR